MITVFEHPLSPYAQKVKIALLEKGIEFTAQTPAAIGSGQVAGDFQRASPRGEVPALVDADVALFDSTIILEYIEERWPEPPLLPADPAQRAKLRMLEDVMDTHVEAINWGLAEIVHFGRAGDDDSLAERLKSNAAQQWESWFRWLQGQLGAADWFGGTAFGRGDLSVIPYVNGAAGFGIAPPSGSALSAWAARANERPSVARCTREAAEVAFASSAASLDQVRTAMEQGLFKREYRDHRLEWMVSSGGMEIVRAGIAQDNIRFIEPFTD